MNLESRYRRLNSTASCLRRARDKARGVYRVHCIELQDRANLDCEQNIDDHTQKGKGGRIPLGSDCTRWPFAGLCSLTALEAASGRSSSLPRNSRQSVPCAENAAQ